MLFSHSTITPSNNLYLNMSTKLEWAAIGQSLKITFYLLQMNSHFRKHIIVIHIYIIHLFIYLKIFCDFCTNIKLI